MSKPAIVFLALVVCAGLGSSWAIPRASAAPKDTPIADHPLFQEWYAEHRHERGASKVLRLAQKLTWHTLHLIDQDPKRRKSVRRPGRGIATIELQRGCPRHRCIGCRANGGGRHSVEDAAGKDKRRTPLEEMSMGLFKNTVDSLIGLERALNQMMEKRGWAKRWVLLTETPRNKICDDIQLFSSSDPMEYPGIYEAIDYLFKKAQRSTDVVTSGWDPDPDQPAQRAAVNLVRDLQDQARGRPSGIHTFALQIKTVTAPFLSEARQIMEELIASEASFQQRFGADFAAHKLDFSKYADPTAAQAAYHDIAIRPSTVRRIVAGSQYMQDRVENVRTLLPVVSPTVLPNSEGGYLSTYRVTDPHQLEAYARPLVSEKFRVEMENAIRELLPKPLQGKFKPFVISWTIGDHHQNPLMEIRSGQRRSRNVDVLGVWAVSPLGNLWPTGGGNGEVQHATPSMALNPDAAIRRLKNETIFGSKNKLDSLTQAWKRPVLRLHGSGRGYKVEDYLLAEKERASILRRCRSKAKKEELEVLPMISVVLIGGKPTPVAGLVAGSSLDIRFLFNLKTGELLPNTMHKKAAEFFLPTLPPGDDWRQAYYY